MTSVAPAVGDVAALGYLSMTALEVAAPVVLVAVLAVVGAWSASRGATYTCACCGMD